MSRIFIIVCLIMISWNAAQAENAMYDKYFDSYGDYKLVERNSDLYIEKMDSSESRRITNTPNVEESHATFTKEGNYIAYIEAVPYGVDPRKASCYIVKFLDNDSMRKPISSDEVADISQRRKGYKP